MLLGLISVIFIVLLSVGLICLFIYTESMASDRRKELEELKEKKRQEREARMRQRKEEATTPITPHYASNAALASPVNGDHQTLRHR